MNENSAKRWVGAILVVGALSLGAWAGVSTRSHWLWLEAHHLAGLAILEVLFIVVSALGALELTRREWKQETPAGVVRSYCIAFGAMLTVSLVGGFLFLLAVWAWAFLNAAARALFYRYPWVIVGGFAGGVLMTYWWARLHPRSKNFLKGLVPWAKGEIDRKHE